MASIAIEINDGLYELIRAAFRVNPKFSRRPNYILESNEKDNVWSIVGLADTEGGLNYYPRTICKNCGDIRLMTIEPNEKKKCYEVSCHYCGAFCHYIKHYKPLPEVIDAFVRAALNGETL